LTHGEDAFSAALAKARRCCPSPAGSEELGCTLQAVMTLPPRRKPREFRHPQKNSPMRITKGGDNVLLIGRGERI
jgi:hypothetical protein